MNKPPNPWETHWFHIIQGTFKLLGYYWLFASFIMLCMMFSIAITLFDNNILQPSKSLHSQSEMFCLHRIWTIFDKAQPLKYWYALDHFGWKCLHEHSPLLTEFSYAAVKLTARLVIIEKIQGCSSVRFQTALLSHLLQQMILSAVPQDGSLR